MSSFTKFRNMHSKSFELNEDKEKEFLWKSKSSTKVFHIPINVERTAVLTNSHKEGGDEFIIFTETLDEEKENVRKGDYIEHQNTTYLIYNEYNHPRKELYLKHQLIECNQIVSFDGLEQPVYYVSSLRRHVQNTAASTSSGIMLSSGEKPLIITADNEYLEIGKRFMILQEVYEILEIDRRSNKNVAYVSVEPTTTMTQDDMYEETTHPYDPTLRMPTEPTMGIEQIDNNGMMGGGNILAGSTITDTTQSGFIQFSRTAKIVKRTSTSVTWQAPMVEGSLTVSVKDENGDIIQIFYTVVI